MVTNQTVVPAFGGTCTMDELRFDDRVVVITGAGRGIGRSHALLFAARALGSWSPTTAWPSTARGASSGPADDVVAEIRDAGGEAVAVLRRRLRGGGGDIDRRRSPWTTFGRIDVVVNNAGINDPAPFEDLTIEQFRRMMDVHFFGTLFVTHAAWKHFRADGLRPDRQHRIRGHAGRHPPAVELRSGEGRRVRAHPQPGHRGHWHRASGSTPSPHVPTPGCPPRRTTGWPICSAWTRRP